MTLTVLNCAEHIEHTLSGPMALLSVIDVVNQTGRHMVGMHSWMFLKRPSVRLSTRAPITLTDATWDESELTLTKTGAFADYTFLAGDQLRVTAGTGATLGYYPLASRVSDDAITLESSIGADAADIDGTMTLSACALPSDFGGILSLKAGDGFQEDVTLTTLDAIDELRSDSVPTSGSYFMAALSFGQLAASGVPVPRLEFWPDITTADTEKFRLSYRAGWKAITSDGQTLAIPAHTEALFIALLRAFARGYEEEDQATLSRRLADVEAGPVFMAARKYDGAQQRNYGPMRGGWLETRRYDPFNLKPRTLGGAS